MSALAFPRAPSLEAGWRRVRKSLLAGLVFQISTGASMAATPLSTTAPGVAHCTGRFDYALPPALVSSGSRQSIYLLDVAAEPWLPGFGAGEAWKKRLATTLTPKAGSTAAAAQARQFDLQGVGPAAWLQLHAGRPDLITLLAMRPVPITNQSLFLRAEASTGREQLAQNLVADVASKYAPGSAQGFCTGAGAFVIEPSMNERAVESFAAPGVELSVQTETVARPDDGQSSAGDPPPGGKELLKHKRGVAGFDGIEERVQLPDDVVGTRLVYTWIFAGRAADGAAPRIRLSASGIASQAVSLDAAWNALLASLRPRPVGVR
jgi:hypothetical protein